jgi:cell division protein FtsB
MMKNRIFTGIIACIAIIAAVWLLISYKDALDELSFRESNKAVLEKDIYEFRKEANNNRNYLDNLRKNPDFQDATARKELGYGAKGERVYRFPAEQ